MYRLYSFDGVPLPAATRPNFNFVGSAPVHAPTSRVASGQYVDLLGSRKGERVNQRIVWESVMSKSTFPPGYSTASAYLRRLQRTLGKVGKLYRQAQNGDLHWTTARFVSMPLAPIGRSRQLVNFEFVTLDPYWWGTQRITQFNVNSNPRVVEDIIWGNNGDAWSPNVVLTVTRQPGGYLLNEFVQVATNTSAEHAINWELDFDFPAFRLNPRIDSMAHKITNDTQDTNMAKYLSYNSSLATTVHTSPNLIRIPPSNQNLFTAMILNASAAVIFKFAWYEAYI